MNERFDALRELVQAEPETAARLRRAAPDEFVAAVVSLAEERGLSVDVQDVQRAIAAGRDEWVRRWIS